MIQNKKEIMQFEQAGVLFLEIFKWLYWGNIEEEGPWIYKTKSRSLCCIQNIQKALICTQCNGVLQDTSQIISSTVQKEKNICGKKTKQKQECFIKIRG